MKTPDVINSVFEAGSAAAAWKNAVQRWNEPGAFERARAVLREAGVL